MLSRGPFGRVFKAAVGGLSGLADVCKEKSRLIHVLLRGNLIFKRNFLKGNFQPRVQRAQRKSEGLVAVTPTLQKNEQHVQGE
jgi:hypothetical protein